MTRDGRARGHSLVLAAAVAFSAPALADPPRPAPPDAPDDAEVTVTARRAPERVQESDRSVAIVSAEAIARAQPRSVPEALRDVPGVAFQSTNRGAGAPILRGLIGPRNLLLFDGIRLNQAHWRNGPLQYLAQVDPWAVERLEVQFGPGSVAYGSDAMGGVVQAVPFGVPAADGLHSSVRAGFRTADFGLESAGEVSARSRAFAARAGGSYRSYDLLRTGRSGFQPFTDYRSFGMRAQAWLALGPEVTVGLAYVNGGVLGAGRTDLLGTGRLTRFDNVDHLAYADLRVRPSGRSPVREVRAVFALHYTDERVTQADCDAEGGLVVDPRGCLAGSRAAVNRVRALRDAVVTPGGYVTAALGRPRDRVRVVVGADAYVDLVDSSRTTSRRPDFAPSERERGNFSSGSSYATLGAFALGEADVLGAPDARDRVVVSGGARMVGFVAHAPNVPVAGEVNFRAAGAAGSASVRYLRGRTLTAYASWSQGLRAPNLQETSLLGTEGGAYVIPARALAPERSNSFEAGVRAQLGVVRFSLAGYVSIVDGMIVREDVSRDEWSALGIDPGEVGALRVQRNTNAAWARYTGAEAWGGVRLARGLTLWAQASAVRGDVFDAAGQQPTQKTPPPLGAFGLRFERGGAHVELFSRWALPQDRLNPVDRSDLRTCEDPSRLGRLQTNCVGTAGWVTVNARAGYRFSPHLRADLVLENLTDARYRYHASGVDEPGLGAIASLTGSL